MQKWHQVLEYTSRCTNELGGVPSCGKQGAIGGAQCGAGDEQRDDPPHHAQYPVAPRLKITKHGENDDDNVTGT